MGKLEISLFGGFYLKTDGRQSSGLVSHKTYALIAYLAIESGRPHSRDMLASLLWPNQPEQIALTNLRQALHRAGHVLGRDVEDLSCFLVTNHDIQFNINCDCSLDVKQFSVLLNDYDKHHPSDSQLCEVCLENLEVAVVLYKGEILAGFSISGCHDFQWWLTCRREEYHHKEMEALKRLIIHYELQGDLSPAIQYARRALELEPWSESLHRSLIGLLAADHQRIAAIRQYETCRKILFKEYGVEPAPETMILYEQICSGRNNTN